jgi:hypothetical protein
MKALIAVLAIAAIALMLAVLPFASCRKGEFVLPSTSIEVGGGDSGGDIKGFFLLNEGNMGSNKASLDYYDSYRQAVLPANLIQAQRDYFGAHTYERIDRPGTFHTEWGKQ